MRVAIYPGRFNPFHNGHKDIYNQAKAVFDTVIVARHVKSTEARSLFWQDPEHLSTALGGAQIMDFTEHLSEYLGGMRQMLKAAANGKPFKLFVIVGIHGANSFEEVREWADRYRDFDPDAAPVYFVCSKEFQHVASSYIRESEQYESMQETIREVYLP